MRIISLLTLLFLAAAVGACGPGDPSADGSAPPAAGTLPAEGEGVPGPAGAGDPPGPPSDEVAALPTDLSCDGLEQTLLRADPVTREGLRAAYGPPSQTEVTTRPNRHVQGATDSIFTLRYGGLEAEIVRAANGNELADRVEVLEASYLTWPALGPGATEEELVGVLGEPTRRTGGDPVWSCGMGAEQPVRFRLAPDGRVASVEIDYYVD